MLTAAVIYFGMIFYSQYRPIKIYVSRIAPMPTELANGLQMEEHKIDPMVKIESPYENASEKILSMEEIRRLRSQIAWSKEISPFYDSLTIQSSERVQIRRMTSRTMYEYQLLKQGDKWVLETATHVMIDRSENNSTAKN
ncbi:MAG: hypothetical protein WDM80_04690 [Limisphaerales bacterium]